MGKYGITRAGDKLQSVVDSQPNFSKHEDQARADSKYINHKLGISADLENKEGTLNQIRAGKGNIIITRNKDDEFFVIPASDIASIVATRRGQHTPNPFVCCGLGVPKTLSRGKPHPVWTKWHVPGGLDGLEDAVIAAIRYDEKQENKRKIEYVRKELILVEQQAAAAKRRFKQIFGV